MTENGENVSTLEKTSKRRKFKSCSNNHSRRWSDLPSDILFLILFQLNLVDYFSLAGVQRSWKLFFTTNRESFITKQAPHAVVLSTHAKRTLRLQNVIDGSTFDVKLPLFTGKKCYGCSNGYLVMEARNNNSGLWLVNPLTKSEYQLPRTKYHPHRVLMASSSVDSSSSDTVIALSSIELSTMFNTISYSVIQIYNCKELTWTEMFCYKSRYCEILDVAIFKGELYLLSAYGQIAKFKKSLPIDQHFNLDEQPIIIFFSDSPRLVVSSAELILVDFRNTWEFKIYKLDSVEMTWIEMFSLGDKALFISDSSSLAICDPSQWKGFSNCIYHIRFRTRCYCTSFNGQLLASYPIGEKCKATKFGIAAPLWYFPHEALTFPFLSLK